MQVIPLVSLVIQHMDKILALRESEPPDAGQWNLPGGHVEPGENLLEAAQREAREETGLGVSISGLVRIHSQLRPPDRLVLRFVFSAVPMTGEPSPGPEIQALEWRSPAELEALPDSELVNPQLLRLILADARAGTRWPLSVLTETVRSSEPEFPTDTLPELETPRLRLRPLSYADEDFIFRHFSDPAVCQYLLDEDPIATRAAAREIIAAYQDRPSEKNYNRWGIALKDGGELIGTCGFHRWDRTSHHADLGYDLNPQRWGQGFMREAVTALLEYGFGTMQLNRVSAVVYPENEASTGLLERLGFRLEGTLRDYHYLRGRYWDHQLFSLLRADWENHQEGKVNIQLPSAWHPEQPPDNP